MFFLISLKKLKIFLEIIDWLWFFISKYAQRAELLQKRKIVFIKFLLKELKKSFKKRQVNRLIYEFIETKLKIFQNLQNVFETTTFLVYFDLIKQLYLNLNVFKEMKFVVIIYHVEKFTNLNLKLVSCTKIQLIFFFKKLFNTTERNYWFTKLEVIDIV